MLEIRRALPVRERRMIGPWCFLDRYGPLTFTAAKPMDVAPHPHIGLQTVTWLLDGEVLHRDSLGSESMVRPGELNVMTSGRGIAHSEETPPKHSGRLSGVQLWVALPDRDRNAPPSFGHHPDLPRWDPSGGSVVAFMGAIAGIRSPAAAYSPILGAEITVERGQRITLPLARTFEHGVMLISGKAQTEDQRLDIDTLYYLEPSRDQIELRTSEGARLILIGGAPFAEKIFMWWNFVARTAQEIAAAHDDWLAGRRFGEVTGYNGPRIEAPRFPAAAAPPPAS